MKFIREVPTVATAYAPHVKVSWGAKVTDEFLKRVERLCVNLGWEVDQMCDLMACMAFETGRTFAPDQRNLAGSGARGLIQFMPTTARDLGTTPGLLVSMTAVQQLDYVEAYFSKYGWHKNIKSLPDMYMAILMPKYIRSPKSAVLFSNGTVAYRQNSGLDANNDGKITKEEATAKVQRIKEEGYKDGNARKFYI